MEWTVSFKLAHWASEMVSESCTAVLLIEFQPTLSSHTLTCLHFAHSGAYPGTAFTMLLQSWEFIPMHVSWWDLNDGKASTRKKSRKGDQSGDGSRSLLVQSLRGYGEEFVFNSEDIGKPLECLAE